MNRFVMAIGLAATCLALGCGGGASDVPDLGQVTGKVTLGGDPLPAATVRFQPADGRSAEGVTDAQGVYVLQYNVGLPGAKVGLNKVYITTATDGHVNTGVGDGDDWVPGEPEKVPAKYLQPGALTAEVQAGSNTFDFALDAK